VSSDKILCMSHACVHVAHTVVKCTLSIVVTCNGTLLFIMLVSCFTCDAALCITWCKVSPTGNLVRSTIRWYTPADCPGDFLCGELSFSKACMLYATHRALCVKKWNHIIENWSIWSFLKYCTKGMFNHLYKGKRLPCAISTYEKV